MSCLFCYSTQKNRVKNNSNISVSPASDQNIPPEKLKAKSSIKSYNNGIVKIGQSLNDKNSKEKVERDSSIELNNSQIEEKMKVQLNKENSRNNSSSNSKPKDFNKKFANNEPYKRNLLNSTAN